MVANVWDFQRAHRCWLMHTITHGGCTNIVRKSNLKADSGRNPCRTRESNPRQYGAWLFGSVLQQLNGPTLICTKHMSRTLKVMMHGMMSVVKPVLNWANVCSPNILRTVRRTMIRFLIEFLLRRTFVRTVRRTICFVLNWL